MPLLLVFCFFVLSLVEFVELVVYTSGKVGICIYFVRQFSVSKIFCFHPGWGKITGFIDRLIQLFACWTCIA